MKQKKPKNFLVKQTNSCLPVEAITQHPIRQAIRKALLEAKPVRMMPLVALSLTGFANPALALPATVELSSLDGDNGLRSCLQLPLP